MGEQANMFVCLSPSYIKTFILEITYRSDIADVDDFEQFALAVETLKAMPL